MYKVPEPETQDYEQKWLEAERELALNWAEIPVATVDGGATDRADKVTERVRKPVLLPRKLEDYQTGATQLCVIGALRKVAKSRKPSQKRARQPAPTS